MMAFFKQSRFKVYFIFLLLVAFIGICLYYKNDIAFKPVWLTGVARHFQSFYAQNIETVSNQTMITEPPLPDHNQTAGEQISITTQRIVTTHKVVTTHEIVTTHEAVTTTTSRVNVTESTTQGTTLTNVSMTQLYHEAYPRNYHYILDEPDVCEQQKPFLVLMVPVAPKQLEARNAIRSTWGNESVVQGKKIIVLFMLGLMGEAEEAKEQEQLSLESQQYHDLIKSNFLDTYKNLTTKTMVIMDWLATRCPQASYAMKIDSDMFLNLENLMSLLLGPDTPKENYITGMVMRDRWVIRDPSSKWYVPKDVYPEDGYPTYLLGMGYVFSNDLPEKLVNVSKDIRPFYIEDAYVGACVKKLGISPSNPPDPSKFKAYFNGNYNRDEFARVITTILGSPKQLVTFWQDLKRQA